MLINKDQENAYPVRIAFNDSASKVDSSFTGPVDVVTFGSEQYHWNPASTGGDYPNAPIGNANPDGPAAKSQITAGNATNFTLPKSSITVLRGKISADPKARR